MEINIIAKGASLKGFDLKLIGNPRCGINDVVYQVLCDYVCFWDNPRWFMGFHGTAWTIEPQAKVVRELVEAGKLVNAKYWKNKGTTIDRENFTVPNINLSGILAISCAILEEFDEIYLWGFDGGGGTWFDSRVTNYQADITRFNNQYRNLLTPGVQIVNMINPDVPSKITCFDQCPLPTTLKV